MFLKIGIVLFLTLSIVFIILIALLIVNKTDDTDDPSTSNETEHKNQSVPKVTETIRNTTGKIKKDPYCSRNLNNVLLDLSKTSINFQVVESPCDTWIMVNKLDLHKVTTWMEKRFQKNHNYFRAFLHETNDRKCFNIEGTILYAISDIYSMVIEPHVNTVTIWGYEIHTHTHGFVHRGLWRAFSSLGFKTYHFIPSKHDASRHQFKYCLFVATFGEDKPTAKDIWEPNSFYILHNLNKNVTDVFPKMKKDQYLEWYPFKVCHIRNINKVHQVAINPYNEYWIPSSKTVFLHYATNLLPSEIDTVIKNLTVDQIRGTNISKNVINYVGTMTDTLQLFVDACLLVGIVVNIITSAETFENMQHQQTSMFSPSIQIPIQTDNAYLPCRLFKNISFGRMAVTNNKHVLDIFPDAVYSNNMETLVKKAVQQQTTYTLEAQIKNMEKVKTYFTYVSKANIMLDLLNIKRDK